jgi:hypothetical protein
MPPDLSVEQVAAALRRVRPGAYRLEGGDETGPTLTLTLDVSAAGRRNAADRIASELAGHGLRLAGDDPVGALAAGESLPVRHAG